jgi:hypothetical protein
MRRPLALFVALAIAACKRREPRSDEDAEYERRLLEQQRVYKGEVIGEEWRRPAIVVDAKGLTYNGKPLAPLGPRTASAVRFEPLYERLRDDKRHWEAIHRPSDAFDPSADVTFAPDTPSVVAASILGTLGEVGYGPQHVRVDGASFLHEHHVVRDDDPKGVWTLRPAPTSFTFGFEGEGACLGARRTRSVPTLAEAATALEEACPGEAKCPKVVFVGTREGQTALDLLEQTRVLLASPTLRGGRVTYLEPNIARGCPRATAPAASGTGPALVAKPAPIARGRAKRDVPGASFSHFEVKGALAPEQAEGVVGRAADALYACFDEGRKREPDLPHHFVTVEFVVNKRGEVASARNVTHGVYDGTGITRCVLDSLGGLQFPESADGGATTVTTWVTLLPK